MGLFSIFKKKKKSEEKEENSGNVDDHQKPTEKEPVNN